MADFKRLFAYDAWANRETLASLRAPGEPPARALRLMAHVVAAETLWWSRIHGEASPLPVWPSLSLEECGAEIERVAPLFRTFVEEAMPERLGAAVDYVNSKGERFTSRVEEILTHVVFHSAYHRGQIALELRAAGFAPAYTDYIHAVRKGLVE